MASAGSAEFVGCRVSVYWAEEEDWFQGAIEDYDGENGYYVRYDDGDEQWEDPATTQIKFVELAEGEGDDEQDEDGDGEEGNDHEYEDHENEQDDDCLQEEDEGDANRKVSASDVSDYTSPDRNGALDDSEKDSDDGKHSSADSMGEDGLDHNSEKSDSGNEEGPVSESLDTDNAPHVEPAESSNRRRTSNPSRSSRISTRSPSVSMKQQQLPQSRMQTQGITTDADLSSTRKASSKSSRRRRTSFINDEETMKKQLHELKIERNGLSKEIASLRRSVRLLERVCKHLSGVESGESTHSSEQDSEAAEQMQDKALNDQTDEKSKLQDEKRQLEADVANLTGVCIEHDQELQTLRSKLAQLPQSTTQTAVEARIVLQKLMEEKFDLSEALNSMKSTATSLSWGDVSNQYATLQRELADYDEELEQKLVEKLHWEQKIKLQEARIAPFLSREAELTQQLARFKGARTLLRSAFNRFDKDGSGKLTADEVLHALRELGKVAGGGEAVDEQEVRQFIAERDTDKSGDVNFAEFCRVFDHALKRSNV